MNNQCVCGTSCCLNYVWFFFLQFIQLCTDQLRSAVQQETSNNVMLLVCIFPNKQ